MQSGRSFAANASLTLALRTACSLRAWLSPNGTDLEALWSSGDIVYHREKVRCSIAIGSLLAGARGAAGTLRTTERR